MWIDTCRHIEMCGFVYIYMYIHIVNLVPGRALKASESWRRCWNRQVTGVSSYLFLDLILPFIYMLFDCNFAGTFRQDFDVSVGIGDLMEVSDDEQAPEHQQPAKKKNAGGLPDIDGEETLVDYIAKFKRACLGKRQQQRDVQKKLDDDTCHRV